LTNNYYLLFFIRMYPTTKTITDIDIKSGYDQILFGNPEVAIP
jgi:hypothetical protein